LQFLETKLPVETSEFNAKLNFTGSAGQGFGMLLEDGLELLLEGEANDSVCKSMNGGIVAIRPSPQAPEDEDIVLIGNCALYGATGGSLYVRGAAGGRFGVRNSGAEAVVEGVGLHGCEYMTSGLVVVLGALGGNFGAGMTGGEAFLLDALEDSINKDYLKSEEMNPEDLSMLHKLLTNHELLTNSLLASKLISNWAEHLPRFSKWIPV
jgi:glutamate synthase domain-containing protein 3